MIVEGCRFSPASRSLPIQPFLLPLNSLFKDRVPFIVYVCALGVEHCLCTVDVPPHAGAFHAIIHEVPTSSLDRTARNWVSLG
jgi:hypothetical protein